MPKIRRELAEQAQAVLGSTSVVVEDASEKFDADLAIPVFAFASRQSIAPAELAAKVAAGITHDAVEKAEPTGGFVNIWLKPLALATVADSASGEGYGNHGSLEGQEVIIEHTDPNPFKELHIGHLYTNTVGESLARLHEAAGAQVHRVSYHGDVGLHIAKAIWAMGEQIDWQTERINEIKRSNRPIGEYYAEGNNLYDDNKNAIEAVNRKIYSGEDNLINELYFWGSELSFNYFDEVLERMGTGFFEARIKESESAPKGFKLVKANTPGVFKENDGAVVYVGEPENLHTRVFINSQGLPTYEAKELGLMEIKDEMYPDAAKFVILTANEIDAYFRVVLAAMAKIKPELAAKTVHISHGMVKLPQGKMSSRTGNVVLATDFLDAVESAVAERSPDTPSVKDNTLAAIKYAFLKQNIGGDIVYDVDESINLEGQTGPYVQYAAVRLQSILAKVGDEGGSAEGYDWQAEKALLVCLARYSEITAQAIEELAPHRVAQYLYELAREFNRYYENVNVKDADPPVKAARIKTLKAGLNVLRHGLGLLNIPLPQKM